MRRLLFTLIGFTLTFPLSALERQPAAEYHARRVAVAQKLHGGAALIFGADEPSAEYETWRQDETFYYLTGWNEPGAALLILAELPAKDAKPGSEDAQVPHEPYREILFLPVRNLRMEKYTGEKLTAAKSRCGSIGGSR